MVDIYFFSSISQFVDRIKKDYPNTSKAMLYFEGKDCFKNKYENTCAKPIFIELLIENKSTYIHHKQIYDMYDGQQLVISFSENEKRKMDEKQKESLYNLVIYFEPKDFNGTIYYNSILRIVNNIKNKEKIRSQVTVYEFKEDDIPDEIFVDDPSK